VSECKEGPVLDSLKKWNQVLILQTQDLRVDQEGEPYIRFIQENSIENSIQDSLPYILNLYGSC